MVVIGGARIEPLQRSGQAGLRVDQELARGNHALAAVESGQDLGHATAAAAGLNRDRAEAAIASLDDHARFVAAADERVGRHQRIGLRGDGLLAPGMFAQVTLEPAAAKTYPLVPSNALIGSGDGARVIVQAGDGSFKPVPVQVGRSSGGMTQILSGLEGGERVVASGQFLIDSEASLSGALQRLDPGTADDGHAQDQSP